MSRLAAYTDELRARVKAGVAAMAEELAEDIRESAPVGKDRDARAGIRSASRVRLRDWKDSDQFSGEDLQRFRQLHTEEIPASPLYQRVRAEGDLLPPDNPRFFRYTSGPQRGQSPEGITVRGRSVLGYSGKPHGTLKNSIRASGADENGDVISARVYTTVPYAYYVEHGIRGNDKPGNQGFFSRPVENRRDQRAAILARHIQGGGQ